MTARSADPRGFVCNCDRPYRIVGSNELWRKLRNSVAAIEATEKRLAAGDGDASLRQSDASNLYWEKLKRDVLEHELRHRGEKV